MNKLLLIGCIFTLMVSCNTSVKYEAPIFKMVQPKEIRILNDDYMFQYAGNPMLMDSLLIVSTFNDENHIAIFNIYSGELVKEFGHRGEGPTELTMPTAFSLDRKNGYLYVCDHGKQSMLRYDLYLLLNEDYDEYLSFRLSDSFARTGMLRHLKDSLFYAPAHQEGRILIGTPSDVKSVVKSRTPDAEKFPSDVDWYNYMNIESVSAVSPDGRYFVSGSAMGGILEIFDLTSDSKDRIILKHFYEPIFEQKGYVYRPISETIGGFTHIAATDKFFYATIHGIANPYSMPTSICKFDWNGNPIEKYECGYPITGFTIDEIEQTIYAVVVTEEGEQALASITL